MTIQDPVGYIQRPSEKFEYVSVFSSVRLWYRGHDGSLWVHFSAVINIPLGSGNINNTIQNPDREVVLVTVSQSSHFIEVYGGCFNSGVRPIPCVRPECVRNNYKPSHLSNRQQDLSRLFHTRHPIPSDTFPKQSGNLFCF